MPAPLKLHIYEHCPFCTRARMIFGLKDLPVELSVIMEGDAETPTRLIGKKAVPILQKHDGSHMGESLEIVRYVDAIGEPMLTAAADEELDGWCREAWPDALALFIPRFTRSDFAELATPEAREAFRLREEKAFGDLDALFDSTAERLPGMQQRLERLSVMLQGRSAIGMSDITLWPVLRSLSIVDGLVFPPVVQAYLVRLERQARVPLLFNQRM